MHNLSHNTSAVSIARTLAAIRSNVTALTSRTESLIENKRAAHSTKNQKAPSKPRRLSDAERAKIVQLANDGCPIAKIAKVIKTTRMTCYTVLHEVLPGFRQRVFHDDNQRAA